MSKKILLADDSITIQKVIELTFSDVDFDVVTVGNGRLALEKLAEVRPDVVLCDIIMPEKDGYEVCEQIKKNPASAHIPVLLLTGAFEPFDQERALRVGADGSLAKPFEPETLIAKVKDLLARARPAGPAPPPQPPVVTAPPPAPPPVGARGAAPPGFVPGARPGPGGRRSRRRVRIRDPRRIRHARRARSLRARRLGDRHVPTRRGALEHCAAPPRAPCAAGATSGPARDGDRSPRCAAEEGGR